VRRVGRGGVRGVGGVRMPSASAGTGGMCVARGVRMVGANARGGGASVGGVRPASVAAHGGVGDVRGTSGVCMNGAGSDDATCDGHTGGVWLLMLLLAVPVVYT
jgi:hypothetical protein